jgi:hypothetical protein
MNMNEKTHNHPQTSDFAIDARRAQREASETIESHPIRRQKAIDGISEMAVMHALGELPEVTDEQLAKKIDGRLKKETVRLDKELVEAKVSFVLADKDATEHYEANKDAYHQDALAEDEARTVVDEALQDAVDIEVEQIETAAEHLEVRVS